MSAPLKLGTRGSALALAQARPVAEKLGAELVVIEAQGSAGVFATALRSALRSGDVDVVVHSYKNLPLAPVDGLVIAAVPKRGDARDALCAVDGLTLDTLPPGARVGTGSRRRRAQLLSRRPDLDVVEIHGEIDTRLERVDGAPDSSTGLDAVVLAAAALDRLDRLDAVAEFLGIDGWPTGPAQGALAIEVRVGGLDELDQRKVAKLDHRPTRLAVEAERAILTRLEGVCAAPIGAHALLDDGLLFLSARVYALDGSTQLTGAHALYPEDSLHPADDLAERVAAELLAAGAADLVPWAGSRQAGGS
ncbi:MAG: hydroxymethylbilane synthase [Pseudolysinimonas sp.]